MPKVYNKYKGDSPLGAVNIMRGTPWGNPFNVEKHGTREEVVAMFERMILASPGLVKQVKLQLKGKDLACCCAPLLCHGDVLLRIANEE